LAPLQPGYAVKVLALALVGAGAVGVTGAAAEPGRHAATAASSASTAVEAPDGTPGAAADFGQIGFAVVAKPKPKPAPEPEPEAVEPEVVEREQQRASRSVSTQRRGLAVENGLTPNAIAVLNAVRDAFPELSEFGGVRAGDPGDHGSGRALDVMTSASEGDELSAYLQSRAGELNISYIIWQQRRWSPGGSWVPMEDRGSATANHYDHVHISVE
jgi:hypothetical protein